MKKYLSKSHIIVTGATGGIGSSISAAFLAEGASVLLIGRNIKDLVKKQKEYASLSGKVYIKDVDVSDIKGVKKLKLFIKNKFQNRVDVLVNAAAIYGPIGKLEEIDLKLWESTIKINLLGTVNMCALVIPFMKKSGKGRIINFSGGGEGPFPRFTAYSASKGAVIRFTESLAEELYGNKIYVNAIAPGAVNTRLLEEVLATGKEKVGEKFYKASLAQKKKGGVSPKKAVELIKFLISSESRDLSGKVISAVWDDWKESPKHLKTIMHSDIYNFRRIKPADRGHDWK